jgi:hypothetical protein
MVVASTDARRQALVLNPAVSFEETSLHSGAYFLDGRARADDNKLL